MIGNQFRSSSTDNVPLYRLESAAHTVLWIRSKPGRLVIAQALHRAYPEGVGVCSDSCRLMGYVNPRGGVREVPIPWPYYPIHVMVNNPRPKEGCDKECPCLNFYDPEVNGPWKLRGLKTHHPFCMYLEGSMHRYQRFTLLGKPVERPDAWYKSLVDYRSRT